MTRPAADLVTASPPASQAGDEPTDPDRHPLAIAVCLLVAASLVVLDQATKQLAEALLDRGEFVPWIGEHIGWQLVYNPGVAFGIRAPIWLPLAVTVVVVAIVARALPRTPRLLPAVSYGLLLAGATGNVIDRLFRAGSGEGFGSGEVIDFVAWGTFPRFNVADSAITIGFVLLMLALWQEERASGPEPTASGTSTTNNGSEPPSASTDGVAPGNSTRGAAGPAATSPDDEPEGDPEP